MLKNWTVTTQAVRLGADGVMMRERYLLNKNHANHKRTEALISIFGNADTSSRIALAGEQFRLNQQLHNRQGGRPLTSYAMEYCLTLPKGYRPSSVQWQSIVKDCCIGLARLCKLNKAEFAQYKQQIRAVLHQQKQDAQRGSGDHVHLIMGKVVGNRVLKELQQKKATRLIKQAFNQSVLKHVGVDYRSYEPIEEDRGRRLNTWQYQHEKVIEALEITKVIAQVQTQVDKWLKAKAEGDDRQLKRQENRLTKTLGNIKSHSLTQSQLDQVRQILALKK